MNHRLERAQQQMLAGAFEEAEKLCRNSIKLGKDVPAARSMLANCLYNRSVVALGRGAADEAEALLQACLALQPTSPLALNNLGSLLLMTDRPQEAVALLERLVSLPQTSPGAWENLALAYCETGQLAAASEVLLRLVEINPAHNGAYLLKEALLAPAVPASAAEVATVRQQALERLRELAVRSDLRIENPLHLPTTYFRYSYHGAVNREINQLLAGVYARACPDLSWVAPQVRAWRPPEGRRVRIGIASQFLRAHSIGNTSRGLVEQLDRKRFEVVVVRLGASPCDEVAAAIDGCADQVCEIRTGALDEMQQEIAGLELDILFYQDVGMEPCSYFLAFSRLAPVQLTSFGHPDTTGIPALDYFISSAWYEREDAQDDYSEQLVRLPQAGTLSYYHRPVLPPLQAARADYGLPEDVHIYCCPQSLFKIQPDMDHLFRAIVERDPQALIVLIAAGNRQWREALMARFERCSPALATRVRMLAPLPYARFLGLLKVADVLLDTIPFNGQNTTLESFAVGTPVITLPGRRQCERHGYGLYRGLDWLELVADDADDYVAKALRVAGDHHYREYCRQRIVGAVDRLFEDVGVVRNFEQAFESMLATAAKRSFQVARRRPG